MTSSQVVPERYSSAPVPCWTTHDEPVVARNVINFKVADVSGLQACCRCDGTSSLLGVASLSGEKQAHGFSSSAATTPSCSINSAEQAVVRLRVASSDEGNLLWAAAARPKRGKRECASYHKADAAAGTRRHDQMRTKVR